MPDRKAELRKLCQQGKFSEALELGARLCRKYPENPELWFLTAAVHGALGAFDKAEECCRKALAIAPGQPALLYNLGIALLRQERAAEAEEVLRYARSLETGNAAIITALADSVMQQAKSAQAISLYREALTRVPNHIHAIRNLATAYTQTGQFSEAENCYSQAIASDPGIAGVYLDWSKMLIDSGDLIQALAITQKGLAQLPAQPDLHYQSGFILSELGRNEEAMGCFETCLALEATHMEARLARAMILRHTGRLSDAASDLQIILNADECNARAHASLAGLFLDEGRIDEMLHHVRRAVELEPENQEIQQHLLMNLHYSEDVSPGELFNIHRNWGERYGIVQDERQRHANEPIADRVLRVGYVSSDFRGHSVAHFIDAALNHHNRSGFIVYCYSNLNPAQQDATTIRLREAADLWRDVSAMSDRDLATLIAADGIDILVDLSGHTSGNRLGAFAYRPAPVQVSWIGYPDTTGLPAMDYRLTDEWADPPGNANIHATETLLRIPDGFLCYSPPAESPDCGVPPCETNGFITFGSFNNLAKVNDSVVASWSRILCAVPDSHLLLKGAALADAGVRKHITERFGRHRIEENRLELISFKASILDHLACYQRVDIALDTFPYNGTTTTCEALWMGVPVVTFAGATHASRVGMSLLQQTGLGEFVCATMKDYESRTVELARATSDLASLRMSLRDRIQASPLMDGSGFCGRLENCYRDVWRRWCDQKGD